MHALGTLWLFFATELRALLRSKRVLFGLVACALPALVVWTTTLMPRTPIRTELFGVTSWYILLQVIVPTLSLVFGSSVISDELDDRTLSYPFTRPVPRASLLLGRWFANALVTCALLALSVWVLYLAARWGGLDVAHDAARGTRVVRAADPLTESELWPVLWMAVVGGAVYTALFAAVAVFVRHPMIVGLAYTFVIESFVANLPGNSRELAVMHYLRSYVYSSGSPLWERVSDDYFKQYSTQAHSLTALALVLGAALVVGTVGIRRRQYVLAA